MHINRDDGPRKRSNHPSGGHYERQNHTCSRVFHDDRSNRSDESLRQQRRPHDRSGRHGSDRSWSFYGNLKAHPDWLFPLYALTGFFVGIVGAVPYVMVNAFPPVVRFSGLSFSYNLAYAIFGGLTPMAVALLLKQSPMGPAYYVVTLCLVGFLVGLYLLAQKKPAGEAVSVG